MPAPAARPEPGPGSSNSILATSRPWTRGTVGLRMDFLANPPCCGFVTPQNRGGEGGRAALGGEGERGLSGIPGKTWKGSWEPAVAGQPSLEMIPWSRQRKAGCLRELSARQTGPRQLPGCHSCKLSRSSL